MSNIKVLFDKIINDAELKKKDIVNKAREESEKIVLKKIDEANNYKEKVIKSAHVNGKELKDRLISKFELNARSNMLVAKKKVLDEIFSEALIRLENLEGERFKDYLVSVLNSVDIEGDYSLVVPDKYKSIIVEFISNNGDRLKQNIKILEVKPSDNLKGGFILEKDGVFLNYSFETILSFIRSDIEFEIANLLFN